MVGSAPDFAGFEIWMFAETEQPSGSRPPGECPKGVNSVEKLGPSTILVSATSWSFDYRVKSPLESDLVAADAAKAPASTRWWIPEPIFFPALA
jgi:hypothetical protein